MYGSLGFGITDPNVTRVIGETVAVLNDVDTRLQALKIGIAQSLPHLAPALLDPSRRLGAGLPLGAIGQISPFGAVSPFGVPTGAPFGAERLFSPWASQVPAATFGFPPVRPF